ncbi:hypothetical protein BJX66DRAFT_64755 [Aspergillus keveii]|uniref:Uncharacterized protein n=1 Tax=Aspergillus keveii TaxID=714993 RepID=A0ABR4GGC9_9EURO
MWRLPGFASEFFTDTTDSSRCSGIRLASLFAFSNLHLVGTTRVLCTLGRACIMLLAVSGVECRCRSEVDDFPPNMIKHPHGLGRAQQSTMQSPAILRPGIHPHPASTFRRFDDSTTSLPYFLPSALGTWCQLKSHTSRTQPCISHSCPTSTKGIQLGSSSVSFCHRASGLYTTIPQRLQKLTSFREKKGSLCLSTGRLSVSCLSHGDGIIFPATLSQWRKLTFGCRFHY